MLAAAAIASRGLGGEHARFHRGMAALDARHVHEARRAADQRAAGEEELRHRLPAALVDRARAVADAAAALQYLADRRMLLPALKLLEGREMGVLVVERDDEAERDLVVRLMVEEPAAPGVLRAASPGCG
jgi:hypothetical protein